MQTTTFFKFIKFLLFPALGASAFFIFNRENKAVDNTDARIKYEKFLAQHPYNKKRDAAASPKGEKKTDGPYLALRQEVLKTLDPALGYVPSERLRTINNMIKNQQNSVLSAGMNWTERGPSNVGGRTRMIMFDPNDATKRKIWAGGVGGGLWYCNDITLATPVWNKVNDLWDNIAVTAMAYDPVNTQVFYVGTGEGWFNFDAIRGGGIWKTSDGGATWTNLSSTAGSNFYYIQKLVVHPVSGDVYAATSNTGIMRSQNGGTSWTQVLGTGNGATSNTFSDLEIGADNTIYAAMGIIYVNGGIYSSSTGNSGSWASLTGAGSGFPAGTERVEIATAPSNANVIYAMPQDGSTNDISGVYKSTNKGVSWTAVTTPVDADPGVSPSISRRQAWYDLSMAVDPNDANTLIVGGIDLFRTTNAGTSWTQITHWYGGFGYPEVHADQHVVTYRPGSSSVALFGNDGGVYLSTNINAGVPSFSSRNTGYNVTQFYSCAMNPGSGSNNFLAGAQDNGTNRFSSAGVNATTEVYGGDGGFCFIDQDNPNYQIASYVYNNFYLSEDGGNYFDYALVEENTTGSFINPADYDDRENILYANSSSTAIMRVLNVTGGFYQSDFSVSLSSEASHIRVSPYAAAGTSVIFVGTQAGRLFKINNAQSASPSAVNITGASFPTGSISCVEIGASENELLVTFSNYGVNSVWYTSNGGSSWVSKEGNLPDMPVRWALFNPDNRKEVLLATQMGVWTCADISASVPSWAAANTGMANVRVDMLQMRSSDKMVIAATHGRGVFSSDYFGNTTAPAANFSSSNSFVCYGNNVTFTNSSTGTVSSYSWDFGSGASPAIASTAGPHSVTYSTPGTKTIKLVVSNSNGSDSITKTVTVNPQITVSTSVSHAACFGSTGGQATAVPSGGSGTYSYLWQGGGTGSTKSGLGAGTYRVTVTDGMSCVRTASVTITQPAQLSTVVTTTYGTCGQSNGVASVSSVTGGTPPYSGYNWSNGYSGITNSGLAAGPYTVTVIDASSCVRTSSVTVSNSGIPAVNAGSNKTICQGGSISIGGSPTASGGVAPYNYQWSPSSSLNLPTMPNPIASPSVTTTYVLVLTDAAGCTSGGSVAVNVNNPLVPVITVSADTVYEGTLVNFTANASGATGWAWAFGDGGSSSAQNPGYVYNTPGNYKIGLTASDGVCPSVSVQDSIVVLQIVGIASLNEEKELRIYPNPVSHFFTLSTKGISVFRIHLLNGIGQVVWSKEKPSASEKVDVSSFKGGAYFLKIETSEGTLIRNITISGR